MNKKGKVRLTLKQKLFCRYYIEEKGNATEAVIKAGYNVTRKSGASDRELAKSIASENLTKPNILEHIKNKLDENGFSELNIKLQHLFLIKQDSDWTVKLRAIDMYYKMTGAYSEKYQNNKPIVIIADCWKISNNSFKKT